MIKYRRIVLLCIFFLLILSVKTSAVGEKITYNGITTYMPEIYEGTSEDDPQAPESNSVVSSNSIDARSSSKCKSRSKCISRKY